ncbi:hypothetical protein ACFV0H_28065 [Streptomyces erythrochromogenes]|uniref:hypothetical protein n=1 Tax=Streptomyces erythrochromogenes TaxID=285574 RepID=UPI001ADF80D5|nr:hypothetical protein [Streptomyces erythrochromogenes]MCX5585977.1 hypothetical protein [Streptomyces erythrochromogenes]
MPWRLAVTAAAVTAGTTVWSATVATEGVPARGFLLILFVAGLPLLARDAPTAFTCVCLLTGMVLLWVSLLGAAVGLGPVVAASLALLAASVADPDAPPGGCSVALAGALLLVILPVGFCWFS